MKMSYRYTLPYFILYSIFTLFTVNVAQVVHTFKGDRFTHYKIDDWISYTTAMTVNAIDTDNNFVYFATAGGGILRFNKYSEFWDFPYTTSSGLRSNNVLNIVYNIKDGFLYALTDKGIDVFKPANNFWQPFEGDRMPARRKPFPAEMQGIKKGKDFYFPPYFRPDNDYLPLFFTERQLHFEPPNQIFDRHNRQFYFTDRMVDEWQKLWIGTSGMGPLYADMYTFTLFAETQSLSHIYVRDIYIDQDLIWVGGKHYNDAVKGIVKWDREDDKWHYYEAQYISSLYKDDVNAIDGNEKYTAFATDHGVAVINKHKRKWRTFSALDGLQSDDINDILISDDIVYVASENGFNWIYLGNMRIYESDSNLLKNLQINQLAVDGKTLWLATRFGLYRFNANSENVRFIETKGVIPEYNLTAVELIKNELWLSSVYGIFYWEIEQNRWHSFPDLSLKVNVRDIASTANAVWFATDRGLLKFDKQRNYWRLFTTSDGLINNDVYHIDPEGDLLWLSTTGGVSIFVYEREGRID